MHESSVFISKSYLVYILSLTLVFHRLTLVYILSLTLVYHRLWPIINPSLYIKGLYSKGLYSKGLYSKGLYSKSNPSLWPIIKGV